MTESEWTRKIVAELRVRNALVMAIVGSKMQSAGWPDRFVSHPKWMGHLEFKGAKTKLTKLQELTIKGLNERNPGTAFVVRYPCRVENHLGSLLGTFDGTGEGLLNELQLIRNLST